ncbi:hypothetical protein [Wukongibacter baidiensis]
MKTIIYPNCNKRRKYLFKIQLVHYLHKFISIIRTMGMILLMKEEIIQMRQVNALCIMIIDIIKIKANNRINTK